MTPQALRAKREAKKNALKTKTKSKPTMNAAAQRKANRAANSEKFAQRAEEQKKVQAEREVSKKARVERSQAKASRRGTGVSNRTDNPIGGGKKKVTKSKGKGGGVTINGKPPTSIQKKLLAGGWSAKELEAKINRKKK